MSNVKIVGVGGCGINAIRRLQEQPLNTVDYIAIDTDEDCLNNSMADLSIKIERGILYKDEIAESEGKKLYESFKKTVQAALHGVDFVFIIGGLGGRTGSAAIPLVVGLANESGACPIALVYTPFMFEGKERRSKAEGSLALLDMSAHSYMVIKNDTALQVVKGSTQMSDAFRMMDGSFSELIHVAAVLESDQSTSGKAELKKLLQQGAQLYIGTASSQPAIGCDCDEALKSAWMELDLRKLQSSLVFIEAGKDVSEDTLDSFANQIRVKTSIYKPQWKVVRRTDSLKDEVRITLVAAQGDIVNDGYEDDLVDDLDCSFDDEGQQMTDNQLSAQIASVVYRFGDEASLVLNDLEEIQRELTAWIERKNSEDPWNGMGAEYRSLADKWVQSVSGAAYDIGALYTKVMDKWARMGREQEMLKRSKICLAAAKQIQAAQAAVSSALTWIIHSEWRIRQCEDRQEYVRTLLSEMSEQGLDRNKGDNMRVEFEDTPKEIFDVFDDYPPTSASMLIGGILKQYYIECPGTAILASKEIRRAIKILSALANGEPIEEAAEVSVAQHEPIQYRTEGRTSYYVLEETEEFKAAMEVIQKKLDVVYPPEDRRFGRCYQIWKLQKRLLMDWYGIEWYTPAERNPGVCFD